MIKYLFQISIFTGLVLSISAQAYAQQVPSTVDPGVILQQRLDDRRAEPSRLEEIISLPDSQTGQDGASNEKIFVLQDVVLDNNAIYTQDDLSPLYADFIGQEVSFADLNAIARRITVQYREDGYVFSRTVLPPQKIKNGVVRLEAIEGRVTDVDVIGEYDDHFDLINKMASKIKSEGPSNTKDIERYLLLIDDLPGVTARSLLEPSETPGGGRLVITIEEEAVEGSVSIDNRGSSFLGRGQGTVVAAFNSLFNVFDRTTFRWLNTLGENDTNELRFFDITHEQQVGTEGVRVRGRYAVTSTEPGGDLDVLDIDGNSQLFELETLYPFVRSREFNVNLSAGFSHLDSQSKISGILTSEDRVRTASIGGSVDFLDAAAGINQIDFELTQGIDIFNTTDDGLGRSRANGEHDFLKANVVAMRAQDLPGEWSAFLSASGQYTSDPLLASEEFAVGGASFGRAFDSGEIVGDRGVAGVVELRYDGPYVHDFVDNYQFYGFYDFGKVWNEDSVVGEADNESLASAGLGLRFNLDYEVSGFLEVNAPLTRDIASEDTDGDDPRIFFSLLKRF